MKQSISTHFNWSETQGRMIRTCTCYIPTISKMPTSMQTSLHGRHCLSKLSLHFKNTFGFLPKTVLTHFSFLSYPTYNNKSSFNPTVNQTSQFISRIKLGISFGNIDAVSRSPLHLSLFLLLEVSLVKRVECIRVHILMVLTIR